MDCWTTNDGASIWQLVVSQGECVHVHEFMDMKAQIFRHDQCGDQHYVHVVHGLRAGPFSSVKGAVLGATMLLTMAYSLDKVRDYSEE